MNELQRQILDEMSAFAERFPAIIALYLFGSLARGDQRPDSDIDIAVDWDPRIGWEREAGASYLAFQEVHESWRNELSVALGRQVDFIRTSILAKPQHGAIVWPAILESAKHPIARVGKAVMIRTPPKPNATGL